MKTLITFLFATGAAIVTATAQTPAKAPAGAVKITFADGREQTASAVRRSGNTLLANIAIATGVRSETGFPISTIRRIDFPNETRLKTAKAALDAGNAAKAIGPITALVAEQRDLRPIPGNIWAEAALLKADALLATGREKEAAPLLKELAAEVKEPDQVQKVAIAQAFLWLRDGKAAEAVAAFDKVIAESQRPPALARAWEGKGAGLLAQEDFDGALLAYLRVPIFYSNETAVMPAALLGSARAYEGLREFDRADEALSELTKTYPDSPEAASAKADIERIKKKLKVGT